MAAVTWGETATSEDHDCVRFRSNPPLSKTNKTNNKQTTNVNDNAKGRDSRGLLAWWLDMLRAVVCLLLLSDVAI